MGVNNYTRLATDQGGHDLQEFAVPFVALKKDASDNNSASSLITLTDSTTTIEIHAIGGAAAIKWISTSNTNPSVVTTAGATADFDLAIPANYFRRIPVPQETIGTASIVGLNKQAGLYNRVAVKSVGATSVLTLQF